MVKTIPLIKRNEKIVDCFLKVKKDYLKFLNKEKIFDQSVATKIASLRRIYIPMSFWIENKYKKKGKTLFLGLSGGQGSGKTTVVGILKILTVIHGDATRRPLQMNLEYRLWFRLEDRK